jgi:hypothetical protein
MIVSSCDTAEDACSTQCLYRALEIACATGVRSCVGCVLCWAAATAGLLNSATHPGEPGCSPHVCALPLTGRLKASMGSMYAAGGVLMMLCSALSFFREMCVPGRVLEQPRAWHRLSVHDLHSFLSLHLRE